MAEGGTWQKERDGRGRETVEGGTQQKREREDSRETAEGGTQQKREREDGRRWQEAEGHSRGRARHTVAVAGFPRKCA
jgi:hypothetical protein